MCDYSLQGMANRPAKANDRLVSTHFVNHMTRGFSAVDDPKIAVCLLPGTELSFEQDAEVINGIRRLMARIGLYKTGRVARFRQINMDRPDTHHDALEFPNGKIVLVHWLAPGQKVTVLQLPSEKKHPSNSAGPKAINRNERERSTETT